MNYPSCESPVNERSVEGAGEGEQGVLRPVQAVDIGEEKRGPQLLATKLIELLACLISLITVFV